MKVCKLNSRLVGPRRSKSCWKAGDLSLGNQITAGATGANVLTAAPRNLCHVESVLFLRPAFGISCLWGPVWFFKILAKQPISWFTEFNCLILTESLKNIHTGETATYSLCRKNSHKTRICLRRPRLCLHIINFFFFIQLNCDWSKNPMWPITPLRPTDANTTIWFFVFLS